MEGGSGPRNAPPPQMDGFHPGNLPPVLQQFFVAPKHAALIGPPHLMPHAPVSEGRYPDDGPSFIEELGQEPNRRKKFPGARKSWSASRSTSPSTGEPRRRSASLENSAFGKATPATKLAETTPVAVKRSARIKNRRNSASQNPRDADFIMTGPTSSQEPQKSSSSHSGANRSVSPSKDANKSPRPSSTKEVKLKGPSTSSSPDDPLNLDGCTSSSSDGNDALKLDDNDHDNQNGTSTQPEAEKKKKLYLVPNPITVLAGDPPKYQRNVCMMKFMTRAHIIYHEIRQKGEKSFDCGQGGERPFQCNHCGKSFGVKWTLDLHLRTHSTERPYACKQCSRAFSNSKDLRRHSIIHSGEKPFKCSICEAAFRRKDNLDRHIKNTPNQPEELAKQHAHEAAAEYVAKQREAKSATAPAPSKPSILGSKLNKSPSTSTAGGNFRSLADCVPPTSEEGVVITADISPTPSQALKEEIQAQPEYHSYEDPRDLHQPVAENSEENRGTSQTFSFVLTADGNFMRSERNI